MAESLPTFDEYLSGVDTGKPSGTSPLPSLDEFLEKPESYSKDKNPSMQPLQSEAQLSYFKGTSPGRIAAAFGHGYMEDISESKRPGEGQIGLDPETDDWLRKNGAFNDYAKGEMSFSKALFEGVVAKGAVAAQAAYTTVLEAPFEGVMAATPEIGRAIAPIIKPLYPEYEEKTLGEMAGRDIALIPEAFPTGFSGMRPHGAIPEPIARAKIEGALDGEAVWNGSKEPTPEQRAQRVAAAAEIGPAEALKAEEFGPSPPTVHEAARQINPETFREYDALSASRDRFRNLLSEGAEGKRAEIEASAPHTAEIADLRSKLEDANKRKSKIYESQLDDLIAKNDVWIASEMEKDTPELSRLRKMVQEMDYRMRDLAPDVSAAYREAEAQMPRPVEDATVAKPDEPVVLEPKVEEAPKIPEAEKLVVPHGIAEDVKRQLLAAGRPAEEAEASAALIEAHYVSRAERFSGRRGTAKEMYEKESPEIRAGREKATREKARVLAKNAPKSDPEGMMAAIERKLDTEKLSESQRAELLAEMDRLADAAIKRLNPKITELEQAKRGSIRLATDDAKATITLMKNADASTFVHETGHHWLDELLKDATHKFAPSDLIKDAETVREWLKAEKGAEITVRQHEKFARGFERYLMEGVAPGKELAGVFAKFKAWLTEIYKTVKKLRSPISDDIRDVFDRLLTKDPEKTVYAGEYEIPEAIKAEEAALVSAPVATPPQEIAPRAAEPEMGKAPGGPNELFGKPESNLVDKAGNIRLDNLNTPEDLKQALRDSAARNDDFMMARGGVISDADRLAMADAFGLDIKNFDPRKPDNVSNSVWATIVQKLAVEAANNVRNLAKVFSETGNVDDLTALTEAQSRLDMISNSFATITAESGRTQRVFNKKDIQFFKNTQDALNELQKLNNGRDLFQMQEQAKAIAKLDTPAKVAKFLRDSKKPTFWKRLTEFRLAAMLWRPTTHVKNIVSNSYSAVNSIAETALAAGIGKVLRSEERVILDEAKDRWFGITRGAIDGWQSALEILKDEDAITGNRTVETISEHALPGRFGKVARFTLRSLAAEDEFFKAIAYRQELNVLASRTARKEGLSGNAFETRVAEIIRDPSEEIMELSKKHADYQTLTKSLQGSPLKAQMLINSNFVLKNIVPFFRTNWNSLEYFVKDRTVLGVASREVRDNLAGKNGTIARDTQVARIALGTSFAAMAVSLVEQGLLTGGGPTAPKDTDQLALKYTEGWQPYSFRIGESYYDYSWIQGASTVWGMAADAAETINSGVANDDERSKIAVATVIVLSQRLMEIASLRGVSDTVKALDNRGVWGERWVQNYLSSHVPGIIGQIANIDDPVVREVRGSLIDPIKAKIPGIKAGLLPKRDIWGNEISKEGSVGPDIISPIHVSRLKNDPVNQRLLALKHFPAKLDRKIRDVELTDAQYDQFSMLSGRLTKQRLDMIVKAPGFAAMPEFIQIKIIKKNIESTRETARSLMMMRNPDILKQALENRKELLMGKNK